MTMEALIGGCLVFWAGFMLGVFAGIHVLTKTVIRKLEQKP